MIPAVTITTRDGSIARLPTGRYPLAIVGAADPSTAIAVNTPASYARKASVIADFVGGPIVGAAAESIEKYSIPTILTRCTASNVGTTDNLVTTGVHGTSVPSLAVTTSNDDYFFVFKVITGGTIGVAGIVFQYSYDGVNFSANTALGTDTFFIFPSSGGVRINFAAGTLLAADVVMAIGHAPSGSGTDIASALTALGNSSTPWEICLITGPIDAARFSSIETVFAGAKFADKMWIGNARTPTYTAFVPESDATYQTALEGIFNSLSTTKGGICAGAAQIANGADFRLYTRAIAPSIAARLNSLDEHVDIAQIDLGALPGITLRDSKGNPVAGEHDETVAPGLDDDRFTVLRTIDGYGGAYVNNGRILSTPGSDFKYFQHVRVINRARRALYAYLVLRLSKGIRVSTSTGKILEEEAVEIESGAHQAIDAVLSPKRMASGGGYAKGRYVQLSRDDLLLQTETLTGSARVVPLGYPKFINFDIGLLAPKIIQV